jgi:nucleoside-diphosphate-sugar epimerase
MPRRFLLTGATGFIGSHVARLLLEHGHEVHALVRPGSDRSRIQDLLHRLHVLELDLASPGVARQVAAVQPQVAVHLAWYTEPGRYLDSPENLVQLELSLRLVRALVEARCPRLVGVGTCFEYAASAGPLSERSGTGPTRLYSACKLALATVLERLRPPDGPSCAWARLFYVYGPGEDERRLVPHVLRSVLAGGTAPLGSGEPVRDYLHVGDVASALEAIALGHGEGAVNVGSGRPLSVRELALAAARAAGRPEGVSFGAREADPRDPSHVCADATRLREEFGFAPRVELEAGLGELARWWAARLPARAGASSEERPGAARTP